MGETLQYILIFAAIIAGALSIFLSHQLMKKYTLNYLSSYFYYILFIYIFGAYSMIGSGAAKYYFTLYEGSTQFMMSIDMFLTILGVPFLILSTYMLIRVAFELYSKNPSNRFTLVYFLLSFLLMAGYAFISIRISRNQPEQYDIFRFWRRIAFSIIFLGVHFFSFVLMFANRKSRLDINERKAIDSFALAIILYPIICLSLLYVSEFVPFLKYIFIFLFLSAHLVPILFQSVYLDTYYVSLTAGTGSKDDLSRFIKLYEISKRETDIVELICRGQSNQEISESLFISLQTVKDHVHRIYTKTGVKNRVQLINLIRSDSL